jgi:hypothetical protein
VREARGRADAESQSSPPPSDARVDARALLAFLAGPIAWSLDLTLSYFLVPTVKGWGTKWPMHLVTVLCLALVAAGLVAGLRALRRPDERAKDARTVERTRFLAVGGLASAVFFGLVIVAEAVPKLMLGARQ